jgi:hypothetical protein
VRNAFVVSLSSPNMLRRREDGPVDRRPMFLRDLPIWSEEPLPDVDRQAEPHRLRRGW